MGLNMHLLGYYSGNRNVSKAVMSRTLVRVSEYPVICSSSEPIGMYTAVIVCIP